MEDDEGLNRLGEYTFNESVIDHVAAHHIDTQGLESCLSVHDVICGVGGPIRAGEGEHDGGVEDGGASVPNFQSHFRVDGFVVLEQVGCQYLHKEEYHGAYTAIDDDHVITASIIGEIGCEIIHSS